MATVIDSLILTLGLNGTEAERGARRVDRALQGTETAARRTGTELNRTTRAGSEGFNRLAIGAAAFLGAIGIGAVATLKNFTDNLINIGAPTARFADNLGMSVRDLSAFTNAAKIAGDSAEGMQEALAGLNKVQRDITLTGQTALANELNMIRVNPLDALTGKAKPLNELLIEIAEHIKQTFPNDSGARTDFINRMGLSGALNFMQKTRAEQERLIREQKGFGAMTEGQGAAAKRLAEEKADLATKIEALGRDIVTKFEPAITGFINKVEKIVVLIDNLLNSKEPLQDRATKVIRTLPGGEVAADVGGALGRGAYNAKEAAVDAVKQTETILDRLVAKWPWLKKMAEQNAAEEAANEAANKATLEATQKNKNLSSEEVLKIRQGAFEETFKRLAPEAGAAAEKSQIQPALPNNPSSIRIDTVKIYTNATDAEGIKQALQRSTSDLVPQANSGVQQ